MREKTPNTTPTTFSPPRLLAVNSPDWQDYELVDSGEGWKLERFGPYLFARPEPEAIWSRKLSAKQWDAVHAVFEPANEENGGHWDFRKAVKPRWTMSYRNLKFYAATSGSRHLGVFPEQASGWDWVAEQVAAARRPVKVLNLFGYTGLISLAAAQVGASVTHVDASRKVIGWAQENQTLSGLQDRPVRWIVDDALKFIQREVRRGARYDGLILDPPKFGRGPKGEVWEFYKLLPELLGACREVLSEKPQFVVLTAYAVKASAITLHYAIDEMMQSHRGEIEAGEICLNETHGNRVISTAIFARWSAGID